MKHGRKVFATVWLMMLCMALWGQALRKGSKAPLFSGTDQSGKVFSLGTELKKGKVVVLFYRGHWCPYCTRQLQNLEDSLHLIKEKQATLVVVTPEKPAYVKQTVRITKASFPIVSDLDLTIMKNYQVSFSLDEEAMQKMNRAGINLHEINNQGAHLLPIPSLFIINQRGEIEYLYQDPNYRVRISVKELLEQL